MSIRTRKTNALISFLCLALAALFSVSALAQQPNAERLRTHVTYLASDKLEGRRTGTPAAMDAANYIAEEFLRLGLKPATQAGSAGKGRAARFPPALSLRLWH